MPFNFSKQQETISPSVTVNQYEQDTSLPGALKAVTDAVAGYAEYKKEQETQRDLGNFYDGLNTYEQQIDDLMAQSDLQKLEAQRMMNEKLRDGDTTNDELAREAFSREMERISFQEEQQGIILESNKRALVRKWSAIRPDMTPEFQKALALNKSLYELDRVGPKASSHFKLATEQMQVAAQLGLTPEYVQRQQRTAAQAQEAENILNMKKAAGTAKADDFYLAASSYVDNSVTAIQALAGQAARAAQGGNAQGVLAAKNSMLQAFDALQRNVELLRVTWNNENGVLVDTARLDKYIQDMKNLYTNSFDTGDARDVVSIADMVKEDAAANFAQSFMRSFYGFELPPKLAIRQVNLVFDGIFKMSESGFFKDLTKPTGLSTTVEQARIGDPTASKSLFLLRSVLPRFVEMSRSPNATLDPNQRAILDEVFVAISDGQMPSPELAAEASPILAALLKGIETNPKATDTERKNAGTAGRELTWQSFNNDWKTKDILNPNSNGAKALRTVGGEEYEKKWGDYVEDPLYSEYADMAEQSFVRYIQYDAKDNVAPFKIVWPDGMRIHGSSKYSDVQTFTQRMNEAFRARANTRQSGAGGAHQWAGKFYEDVVSGYTPEGEVSVQEGDGVVRWTEEDLAPYAN